MTEGLLPGLDRAIDRARAHLLRLREPDGSFPDRADLGPSYTAFVLIALAYAGCDLPAEDQARIVARLRRQQRADGSWVAYPFASAGDPCATAAVWAALLGAGVSPDDPAAQRARAYVDARGGLDAVVAALYEKTNFAALFVAMAGRIDPDALPMPPPGVVMSAPLEPYLRERFDYLSMVVGLVCAGAIVDDLRQRRGAEEDGTFAGAFAAKLRSTALAVEGAIEAAGAPAAIELLRRYQNPDGSLDSTTFQTALLLAAYCALGVDRADPGFTAAAGWLRGMLVVTGDEAWFNAFTGDVWTTALAGRALLASGVKPTDPAMLGTLSWLTGAQILDGSRVLSRTRPGKPTIGGWAFEAANVTMPDCDDTGLVLATLGMASDATRSDGAALPEPLASIALTAVERACAWLEGIQCADGGWSAFDVWDREKPRGPLYTEEKGIGASDFLATIGNVVSPPIELGSPAWEDVTARVLLGLGWSGYTADAPVIARAIDFLRRQQLDHGGFWGRWMVNYLPTTACVLLGLSAVELPASDPMIGRAIAFLLAHQNPDGGWGEDEETYPRPDLAGTGPSMAPLTGLVVSALIEAGLAADHDAIRRGVAYLLREQRGDGSWPNGAWLHAFFPPQSYYFFEAQPALYPLEALGRYRALVEEGDRQRGSRDEASLHRADALGAPDPGPARQGARVWDDAFLDRMRKLGDPVADRVVEQLVAEHETEPVNTLLRTLVRSDDPVPPGLPPLLRAYFDETSALPGFADPRRLAVAARLFARAGWTLSAGLFCSSLPQTYAVAKGAKVLAYSGRLDADTRRRILETAQFIFDVTDPDGLAGPEGRGVRSAQKVRLMHAALRRYILTQSRWSLDDGLPINQEDLGATLMSFSAILLDVLDRLGVETTRDERESWMHLWNVVGALLGIDPDLLPADEADGAALMDAVRRRHFEASPQGRMLASALCDCMRSYLPAPGLEHLPATLVRHLAGDACADMLGLPRADWTSLLVDAAGGAVSVLERRQRDGLFTRLAERFSAALMQGLITAQRDGKQAPFRLPASLRST
ncbi:MAG: oxygenase MpaB family protein [Byssovorax sp.]